MLIINYLSFIQNKKNIYLVLLFVATTVSCSKEENPESVSRDRVSAAVSVVDGKLKFTDSRQADSVINVLLTKDDISRRAWYDSIGFLSQESL